MSAVDLERLRVKSAVLGSLTTARLTMGAATAGQMTDGFLDAVREYLIATVGRSDAYEILTRAADAALDGATLKQGDAVKFQPER